ncbi:hypothetical protein [Burkholderia lata]|uniref:hypothetical protein n=1 Tax=Burkholderia lata (strain ATCC 17760 / DSM 23089 / LMG 22485 / NCIMB 9086 / R18194 / 383) TaxID=482957 RepID=UPI00158309E0|nr:hypothetical protein [Burkholderia lata]
MLHESGRVASGVADRVLRDQQSVQRFAQRGKHRFLITNAGLLRWTQSRTEMSCSAAIGGTQGDHAAARSALLQGRDASRWRMSAKSWRECVSMDAAHLLESVSKRKDASGTHRAADHAAAHQQCCFPQFIALRNMVVMLRLARLSTCRDR